MKRAAVVGLLLFCACSSTKSATKTTAPATKPASVHVGDTVKTKDGVATVYSFAQGVADVQECGGDPNPLNWRLSLSDHTTVDADLGKIQGQLASGKVASGECVRGKVGFTVPKGAKVAAVVYAPFGDEAVPFAV